MGTNDCGLLPEEILELMTASMKRHDDIRRSVERLELEASEVRKTSKAYKSREKAIRLNKRRAMHVARANRKLTALYVASQDAKRNKKTEVGENR